MNLTKKRFVCCFCKFKYKRKHSKRFYKKHYYQALRCDMLFRKELEEYLHEKSKISTKE